MWKLAKELFPICRSITGQGLRDTLIILAKHIPLEIYLIPSGTQAFDWVVPSEWNIRGGWLKDPLGQTVCDFRNHNLHIVGYSEPINRTITLDALQPHLHSLPDQPNAIPYRTSYYNRNWGFCLTHRARQNLAPGVYHAYIDSTLAPGTLDYGELIIEGESIKEIFLSTYICHPSMANDQLSGPVVMVELAKWLMSQPRYYTYRIVFAPETIGSIVYLSRNLEVLRSNVIAAFNIACMGNVGYQMISSRGGNTLADRIARHVLKHYAANYKEQSFLDRGGDERQYCSPGVDLPMVALWKNVNYPEYHTSLDDLSYISELNLELGLEWVKRIVRALEANRNYRAVTPCEPQMGKRGLYRGLGTASLDDAARTRMNILAYCDGRSALEIAEVINRPLWDLVPFFKELETAGLIDGTVSRALSAH